ncbi:hypothetical protein ACXM1Q_000335 [Streptococcus sp. 10F2]
MAKFRVNFTYYDTDLNKLHEVGEVVDMTKKRAEEVNKRLADYSSAVLTETE